MFQSESLKRRIYIASGSLVSGVRQFDEPVPYDWNWRGLSSGAEMLAFGPSYMDYRKSAVPNEEVENIKRFDAVWMDVTPSDTTDVLASDADFYVDSVVPGAGGIAVVTFKRLTPDA